MEMNSTLKSPWDTSVQTRIDEFYQAKNSGKKCVLFLYEQPDASTFRYRAHNVIQRLTDSKEWSMHYFFSNTELDMLQPLLSACSLVVICRIKWTYGLDLFISKAKTMSIPVLFDIDDLIFDLDYLPQVMNTLGIPTDTLFKQESNFTDWFALCGRNYLTASRADGFITTNDFLGSKLSAKFHKPYSIIHNSINDEQMQTSNEALECNAKCANTDKFVVGYFSGSPSHMNDFSTVAPEIHLFLSEHKDAILRVVGYMKFPSYLQEFIDNGQIEFIPPVSYLELQNLIAQVDVNIVPLLENDFTNCKSELKYFEAAIVDTLTVATPTYAYRNAITHGHNGFLCRPGQWYDTLQDIYYHRIDEEQILANARKHAIETYYGSAILDEIEHCFNFFYQQEQ